MLNVLSLEAIHPPDPKQNITFQSEGPTGGLWLVSHYSSLEQIFNSVEFSGSCDKMVGRDIVMKPRW